MNEFHPAKKRVEVSVGESVRILRELQELSQSQLSELTGIPQSTISAIEACWVNLGVERAKVLARALKCHPAVLAFSRLGRSVRGRGLTTIHPAHHVTRITACVGKRGGSEKGKKVGGAYPTWLSE
jgi:predicted transcriptional regulator